MDWMRNLRERFDGFKFGDKEIKVSTPKQAIEKFAEIVRDVVASM
jgi:hypothetical protein